MKANILSVSGEFMNKNLKKLTYSAILMAAAYLLPFLTANNQELGNMLCPMHIPIMLCGIICGPVWGGVIGFATPLLRSFIVGMPPFPLVALPMAFELAVYGAAVGLLYMALLKRFPRLGVYISLLTAMVLGRIALGIAKFAVLGYKDMPFGLSSFIAGSVLPAWPGIVIQFALIPPVIYALKKAKLLPEK